MPIVFKMLFFRCVFSFLVVVFCVNNVEGIPAPLAIDPLCKPPRGTRCVEIDKCIYFKDLLQRTSLPQQSVFGPIREHMCGFNPKTRTPEVCCSEIQTYPNPFIQIGEQQPLPPNNNNDDIENFDWLPKDCGQINHGTRITGGSISTLMEFPWMALLLRKDNNALNFYCAGNLINERYVLTAAHCVDNKFNLIGIRLGEFNVNTQNDCDETTGICSPPVQDRQIEEIFAHPDYNKTTSINDIALIKLATPADFSYANVKPICLPLGKHAKASQAGKYGVVVGWGLTQEGFNSAKPLKIEIPIFDSNYCRKIYRDRVPITKKQICAGGVLGRDACSGDSGGPLMVAVTENNQPKYVLHGIVSFGVKHCGIDGQPGVYTKVGSYVEWILKTMQMWGEDDAKKKR